MPSFATMPSVSLPQWLAGPLLAAISRLEFTLDPRISLRRLQKHPFTWRNEGQYLALAALAIANLSYIASPGVLGKLLIVAAYVTGLLIPFTSQFILPATPIFSWLVLYWSSKYTPNIIRPSHIWVSVLPTLESVLYGANISDILTRITNPVLDILAWLPYGILHFGGPFVAAALIWIFGPPGAVKFFAKVFGYMNVIGVAIQIFFPSAPPWYELRHGITPASYGMKGSPGGLARIDALFGGNGYTNTFTNSPMPFGAFPSLHAGCSTVDALLLNHFFPRFKVFYVIYVLWLYWSTMYLTHHYLIDLVAGAALAVSVFYYFVTKDPIMRDWHIHFPSNMKPINHSNDYNSIEENGHLSNGDAEYLRDLENTAASSNSRSIGMQDLAKDAQSAQDFELPHGNGGTSRRGSIPNSSSTQGDSITGLAPASAGDTSAGTTSAHSPRMAAAASIHSPRGPSPAGHTNPFLSAPPLNRSASKDGDKNLAEAGLARPRTPGTKA